MSGQCKGESARPEQTQQEKKKKQRKENILKVSIITSVVEAKRFSGFDPDLMPCHEWSSCPAPTRFAKKSGPLPIRSVPQF